MPLSIKNPTTVRRAMRSYARHRKSSHCRGRARESCTRKVGCFWTHGKDRSFCRKIQLNKRGSQSCDCPPRHKTNKKHNKMSKFDKMSRTFKSYKSSKHFKGGSNQNGCVTWFGTGANCISPPTKYDNNILDFHQGVPVKKYIPFVPLNKDVSYDDPYRAANFNAEYAPYNS